MNKIVIVIIISVVAHIIAPVSAAAGDRSVQSKKIQRIILVTIDTLRADHLGYMGYPRDTSPFLDTLAREGVLFKNAFTVIPYTAPSHASIFTSLYPLQHKVIDNRSEFDKKKFVTMAEYLKEQGYETAAFVSVILLSQMFHQGFDHMEPAWNEPVLTRKDSTAVISAAIEWLRKKSPGEDIFLWIHLFDTHTPYTKGIEYRENPLDPMKGKDQMVRFWTKDQGIEPNLYKEDRKENIWQTMNLYDGEIQYMDSQIKRLYEFMEGKGLNSKSLWVITSDHGEGLGSHFFYGHHARLYDEQLKTPIIFYSSDRRKGSIVEDLVENIDLLPTLSELVGFPLGKSPLPAGRSLAPLLFEGKRINRNYIFSESGKSFLAGCKKAMNMYAKSLPLSIPDMRCVDTDNKFSLRDRSYKYIHNPDGEDEFYNLQDDPREINNLGSIPSPQKDQMKKILRNFIERERDRQPVNTRTEKTVDGNNELQEEVLKSLGY